MDAAPALGLTAAVVSIVDTIPYIRDTLRGTTRPHRGTWLIWGVLAVVAFASQRADGASWSLGMAGAQAVVTCLIFGLAIRRGEGGVSRPELVLLAVASAGVLGWLVADEPVVATACVVAADLLGVAMMMPKTYRRPDSETLSTFGLASLAGLLATLSVGTLDIALLLYPVYFFLANAAIALLIVERRSALRRAAV